MVATDFLKIWEKTLGSESMLELARELEEVDGYVSELYINNPELEHDLLIIRVIERNLSGGYYPGKNFCAFMNQLDNPIN